MNDPKTAFDLFVCGGEEHVPLLENLLPMLLPHGRVHLGSCFLSPEDLHRLDGLYDVLHEPHHSRDGYRNFELFAVRDLHKLATAPYFIKLDADVQLASDWFRYVEESIAAEPEAVLFGPRRGAKTIDAHLGALQITGATKVIGGFYVGRTDFFNENQRFFDLAVRDTAWQGEDTLRSLVVHAVGAGDRLHVIDSGGRVLIHRPNTMNP
ncbi:MAG: hypothetical protein QOI24_1746 [Acidobacteriota bacterium]|jgi:hypothetical protein|nr:hypothetical protein [Acidobacteriota bacterium]